MNTIEEIHKKLIPAAPNHTTWRTIKHRNSITNRPAAVTLFNPDKYREFKSNFRCTASSFNIFS